MQHNFSSVPSTCAPIEHIQHDPGNVHPCRDHFSWYRPHSACLTCAAPAGSTALVTVTVTFQKSQTPFIFPPIQLQVLQQAKDAEPAVPPNSQNSDTKSPPVLHMIPPLGGLEMKPRCRRRLLVDCPALPCRVSFRRIDSKPKSLRGVKIGQDH
ncbi:hypothetical protein Cob_v002158 [Colletotrichum orbiculare MAFF 240422]|uniref:Uncharacterized protein n=1 Tax=Colletotrichum orbiculare (strain 104-T / ATCC 96160 / CBS 514.97 / LARS 414 / MAFF 240422) TaxID=1213857 RepID=A0A484G621_COLOR|nr:hypothetical protein Cob_v002158 [Colletotrichum orbiculare MAFF 240422]